MAETSFAQSPKRAAIHYFVAIIVFTVYGSKVCPFIESLPTAVLLLQSATVFLLLYFVRLILRTIHHSEVSLLSNVAIFSFAGLGFAAWYGTLYGFPLESNIKVLFGMTILGIVISLDLAIDNSRYQTAHPSIQRKAPTKFSPLAGQIGWGAMLLVIMVTALLGLVVTKDLLWLVQHTEQKPSITDINSIIKEFVFVALVVLGYIAVISKNGASLIHEQLERQTHAMVLAANGHLEQKLPANHTGELGVIAYYTNKMLNELHTSYDEINRTRDATIIGLSTLAEVRDNETGAHILRTQNYVRALAYTLRRQNKYSAYLSDDTIDLLYKSAPLHDVGKVGIPDAILLKPGKLTDEEFVIMKTHAQLGADALSMTEKSVEGITFLRFAKEIAATHHEKWDGSGYPLGLAGNKIPLSGRLMALADVYDALISKRVYKPAFSHQKAKEIILQGKGTHFDPAVVEAFLACEHQFVDIAAQFADDGMLDARAG